MSVPVRHGPWWYVTRTVEGLDYPIHCRGASAEAADETVILDQNAEAAGHEFFDLGALDVSPDHTRLAWSSDVTGGERFTMRIRDLRSNADLDDVLEDTYYSTAWSATASTSSTPAGRLGGRTRSGGTASAHPRPATSSSGRRTTSGSSSSVELTRSERYLVLSAGSTDDDRGAPSPPTNPGRARRRGTRARARVRARSLGRPVRDPDQSRRRGLPRRHRAAGGLGNWSGSSPTSRAAGSRIEAFDGYLALHEWARRAATHPAALHGRRRRHAAVRGRGARRRPRLESRVRDARAALRLRVARHAAHRVRRGRRHRGALAAQADGVLEADLSRYRSARTWAMADDGTRCPSIPSGTRTRRSTAPPCSCSTRMARTRRASRRGSPPAALVARPRRGVGARLSARRWRARPALVPGRQVPLQAQHVHRRRCRRRAPRRRGVRRSRPRRGSRWQCRWIDGRR